MIGIAEARPSLAHPPSDLRQHVAALVADILDLPLDPMRDLSRRDTAAWDSINHLRLILELEQTFDISISDAETADLMSLRDIEALLVRNGVATTRETAR